jgi:hypothetical protein
LSLLQANYQLLINRENQQQPHPVHPYPQALVPDISDIYTSIVFTVGLENYTLRVGEQIVTFANVYNNTIGLHLLNSLIVRSDDTKITWLINGLEFDLTSEEGHNAIRRNVGDTISLVTV